MNLKIQTSLILTVAVIILIGFSTGSFITYNKSKNIAIQYTEEQLSTMAQNNANEISQWFGITLAEMNTMASTTIMNSGALENIIPYLVIEDKRHNATLSYAFVDNQGICHYSDGSTRNLSERDFVKQGLQGQTTISNPIVSKIDGKLQSVMAVPIKKDNVVIGVLLHPVDVSTITEIVSKIKIEETGFAYLLQNDGLTIAHPNKEAVMKNNMLKDEKVPADLKAVTEKMVKGESGVSRYNYEGIEKYVAYAPVKDLGWSLAVAVPAKEVYKRVAELMPIYIMTALLSIITIIVVLNLFFKRLILNPLHRLQKLMAIAESGDLRTSMSVFAKDEFGELVDSFNRLLDSWRDLLGSVMQSSSQLAACSQELTATSDQSAQVISQVTQNITEMAYGTEKQQEELSGTVVNIETMSNQVRSIVTDTNLVAEVTQRATITASEGNQSVEKAMSQMVSIEKTVTTSSEMVEKLGQRSKEIGRILEVISGIAGQTNLLALNAAIEAARAGEQGRGFAVVAEEVRKLAEQSQEAAQQISVMINEIQIDTEHAVVAMKIGTQEVKAGTEVVNTAGQAFHTINNLVGNVSKQIEHISESIQVISDSSNHVVVSMQEMNGISKQSVDQAQMISAASEEQAASMQEIAGASRNLAQMAEKLNYSINKFSL